MSVTTEIAKRDNSPAGLIRKYETDFTSQLPSHIKPQQWIGTAIGALRKSPEVAEAAQNNVGAFLSALLTASRLGLDPGTEAFYLVPQSPRRGAPREIMGVVGYQGLVELMYRAGAISSVIVEVVRQIDKFSYVPGRDERPLHEIDWDAEDRGPLRLVYAYAVMKDGATSKVVVLNKAAIAQIKKSSASASSDYSPWAKHPESMWMKSACRQLAKWIPTSPEYRRQQLRDAQAVIDERGDGAPRISDRTDLPEGHHVDQMTGEVVTDSAEAEVHEGEVVEDQGGYDDAQWMNGDRDE